MATGYQFKDQNHKNQEKRGKQRVIRLPKNPFFFHTLFFVLHLLVLASPVVSAWDGAILTQADFQALQAVKRELVDFKGVLDSWNGTGSDACSRGWIGIRCVQGQVTAVQLPWKGLGGKISEKIGELRALRRISLHDNVLAGAIPQSLGLLPNLRGLYLFNNRLSGSIPASIAYCPRLQTLDLSNNSLSGVILSSLANSTNIFRLNLSFNSLSGSIPVSFTQSPSLIFLALQHNNLSGTIPNTWGTGGGNNLFQLQSLTLDHNRISGSVPDSLSQLGKLEEISLSNNQLQGRIPSQLGQLSTLQKLDLSNNAINGSIPASLFNLSSLVSLNLESNRLGNRIPEAIDRLRNLSVLNLRENQLTGSIPARIGNVSGITQLDLSGNYLGGEIPSSLAQLSNLSSFNVSYNNLSGVVPSLLHKKFNSSCFAGNLQLCGYSISTQCASPPPENLPTPSRGSAKHHHHRKLSTKDIILILAGVLLAILLLLCCILLCCLIRRRAASKSKDSPAAATSGEKGVKSEFESGGEGGGKLVHFDGPFVFTADDLLCATAEIMGKSNYGTAYKATLEDGNEVAVKRLREKMAKSQKEFEVEVGALGRIRHPNILALRAYYMGPKGEKLLVFDYMPKGSLASFLHARGPESPINWPTRMNIAIGISRGLRHLHAQENMVHGNLTSSNVLLDQHANAKIGDVGLSRLMTNVANTNVVATAGTLGYRAPELSKLKKANAKTDVYSLGVIMLELLTGKSPGEAMNGVDLPEWVASVVKEEWTNEVFDLEIMNDGPTTGDELLNALKLALHCVDPTPTARPEVEQILQQLEEMKPELASGGDDEANQAATISNQ